MASRAQLEAELTAVNAQLTKVQAELLAAQNPKELAFTITGLQGVFADDVQVAVGDMAHVVLVRGSVGELNSNGIWNNIKPGTIVEYWVTRGTASTYKAIEAFYAA